MKKLFLFAAFFIGLQLSFAATLPSANDEPQTKKEVKKAMERAAMEEFSKLSMKDYEQIRGKKLNFFERMSFKMSQKRVKQQLKAEAETEGFNIGGFALGFFLGLLGVLIAYIASSDSNLRKWSWIGLGAAVVLSLVLVLLVI